MNDWENFEKELTAKLSKLEGLGTEMNDKIQASVNEFVQEYDKMLRAKAEAENGKPVYEYRANGFVTRVYKDGTKTVTPEDEDEKAESAVAPEEKTESVFVFEEKTEAKAEPDGKPKAKTKGDKILGMLPFLDEESLHELTVQFIDGNLEIEMKKVLSFLEEEDVALLMKKIMENGGEPFRGLELADVLPFADEEDIGEIFKKKVKEGIIDESLINYVDEDCWHEIVEDYCKDENSELDIDKIYPHLDEDDLKLLFKTYLKRQK